MEALSADERLVLMFFEERGWQKVEEAERAIKGTARTVLALANSLVQQGYLKIDGSFRYITEAGKAALLQH